MEIKKGTHTPWGPADHVEQVAPGLTAVSTPSHGGIHVDTALLGRIPLARREWSASWAAPGWFEEDCAWAFVVVAFPEHFPIREVESACKTVKYLTEKYPFLA